MLTVLQRVKQASVTIEGQMVGQIEKGALIFLAVAKDDTEEDIEYLVRKISELRMFEDDAGKMNLATGEVGAEFLVVSQFTLLGDCRKGRRPSFDKASSPEKGEEYYNLFVQRMRDLGFNVATGSFRAMMDVHLVNDGPVTFILDSKKF
ncbi:MAG: D-tyrosyl-tRNA(Tyr) deacylase [Candidatus Omnitrophica bacterium]|nr:D-tyrosyl-tRNA(Tyr) deacylase [Candidatus Omnitrophota bacterium]